MAWNQQQIEALYANVYRRRMECPACGGPLNLAPTNEMNALGVVECAACKEQHLIAQRNDPLQTLFRDYTAEENKAISAAERRRITPVCPVDGTEMDVHLQRSLGRTSNAVIRCRRCARKTECVRTHG